MATNELAFKCPHMSFLLYKRMFVDGERLDGRLILAPGDFSVPADLRVGLYGLETTGRSEKVSSAQK